MAIEFLRTFEWKGQLRYACPCLWPNGCACGFDTYTPELLLAHMNELHNVQAEQDAVRVNLFDSDEDTGKETGEVKIIGAPPDIGGGFEELSDHGTSGSRRPRDKP